jgi:putative oxidoreductase
MPGVALSNSVPRVSTEDDRPRFSGGYSDSGRYSTGGSGYPRGGAHAAPDPADAFGDDFDESGYSSATTVMAGPSNPLQEDDEFERARRAAWHPGADVGLLVLRLVLGGIFILHGLQKLFGLFNGPGISGFSAFLSEIGFSQSTLLTWVTGLSELIGGALLVLGLFTPLGAAAILGVMLNVIYLKADTGAGFLMSNPNGGYEWEASLAGAAFALLFAGPGRVSLDRPTPWYRHAVAFGIAGLIVAGGVTAITLLVFR